MELSLLWQGRHTNKLGQIFDSMGIEEGGCLNIESLSAQTFKFMPCASFKRKVKIQHGYPHPADKHGAPALRSNTRKVTFHVLTWGL